MVRVGLAGVGFMGWIHYLAYQRSDKAKLCAFSSRDDKKRVGDWRGIKGNFGPPGEQIDVASMKTFATTEEMVRDPDLDVIDICLPPHLHVDAAIAAIENGKHVFCEKPLALNTVDCDKILAAAKMHGRLVMVAQVLPYIGPYAYAARIAASGEYGKPTGGYFKRIISNPDWIPDFFDPDRVGGPLVDLHVHDAHFVRLLFGMPTKVYSRGSTKGNVAKFCHTIFEFADPSIAVAASSGTIDQGGRPFTHGFELYLERASVQFEFAGFTDGGETMPLKVLTADGGVLRPELPAADDVSAFVDEIADMATSVLGGKVLPQLEGLLARDAIHLCLCEQQSVFEARPIGT
jgi:predicted dehydrogenase